MDTSEDDFQETLLTLTADIAAAHVSNNKVSVSELSMLISNVHAALAALGKSQMIEEPLREPAVSIRASIKADYLICLEDGKKFRTLKRHLRTSFGLTPDQYRARWNLPADYPMVAPSYSKKRSELAIGIGLGRKPIANPDRKPNR